MKNYRHCEVVKAIRLTLETKEKILKFQHEDIYRVESCKYRTDAIIVYRKGFEHASMGHDCDVPNPHAGELFLNLGDWMIITSSGIWARSDEEFKIEFEEC